ncbi:hypothetical protein [Endothiovibrio diazotrophicus]
MNVMDIGSFRAVIKYDPERASINGGRRRWIRPRIADGAMEMDFSPDGEYFCSSC